MILLRHSAPMPEDGGVARDLDKERFSAEAPDFLARDGEAEACLPVFQQTWWQTIARGRRSITVERVTRGGRILGQVSFVTNRSKGIFVLGEPPSWTHLNGPWLSGDLSDTDRRKVLEELAARLPERLSLELICHPRKEEAALVKAAFGKEGFDVHVQNTYTQAPNDMHVMSRINNEQRKNIIRAAKKLKVGSLDAKEFVEFYGRNLRERGVESYAPLTVAQALLAAGRLRNPVQTEILAASHMDGAGEDECLDAAIACAWDKERYYYFMSTRRRARGHTGRKPNADAIKLLTVHAMDRARSMGLVFDADGVTDDGAERLYRDILKMPTLEHRYRLKREYGLYRGFKVVAAAARRFPRVLGSA